MIDEGYTRTSVEKRDDSFMANIGTYFVSGFLWSIGLEIVIYIMLLVIVFLLLLLGIIGFIVGFAALFLAIGWLNVKLMGYFWKMDIRTKWTSLIGHGLLLFLVLLIVHLPLTIYDLFTADTLTNLLIYLAIAFGPFSIIDGFVVKKVAGMFEETHQRVQPRRYYGLEMEPATGYVSQQPPPSQMRGYRGPLTECPYCGAVMPYGEQDVSAFGFANCRSCGAQLRDPRYTGNQQ